MNAQLENAGHRTVISVEPPPEAERAVGLGGQGVLQNDLEYMYMHGGGGGSLILPLHTNDKIIRDTIDTTYETCHHTHVIHVNSPT